MPITLKPLRIVLILISAVFFCFNSIAQQSNEEFVQGEIYVKVKSDYTNRVFKNTAATNVSSEIPDIGNAIAKENKIIENAYSPFFPVKDEGLSRVFRIKIKDGGDLLPLIAALKDNPAVEYAELVRKRAIIANPNDPSFGSQWFLNKVKAPQAWDVNPGSATIKIAVVDNAIDTNHPDLAGNMLAGRDVADDDNNPNPPNATFDHGTHVAGILSAVTNNSVGIAAAANNRVKIIPVKATRNTSNNRYIDEGFKGIRWAADNGADIISLSWGGGGYSQTEQDVITYAYNKGILVIAAAGNDNNEIASYPAAYDHVISVAALDDTDTKSSFSTFGSTVDISAPGRSILSTLPYNTYGSFNGTSMATPLVASCAGYLLSCFPTLSPDSIETILKFTADKIEALNPSYEGKLGAGRVNLLKAVSCQNSSIFNASISANPSSYFCEGDSANLSIPVVSSESFEWFLNGTSTGNVASSFFVKNEGNYTLKRVLGDCELESDPFTILHNKTFTNSPSTSNYESNYCEALQLQAIPAICSNYGPNQYNYSGPQVGFDGLEVSGPLPTVNVSNIGGLIDSVAVIVIWQKKDGGNYLSCGTPDGGGTPFNNELSFQLKSPSGKIIDLVKVNTYGQNAPNIGDITTVFSMNGATIAIGSSPASGNFAPAGDLSVLENDIPSGEWTLIAEDDALIDPLCVSGFGMIIKTKEPTTPPIVTWYDAVSGGNQLGIGNTLTVSTNTIGNNDYFVAAQCEGMCPSERVVSNVIVSSVPKLFALPVSEVLITPAQLNVVITAQTMTLTVDAQNLQYVNGLDQSGDAYNFLIANKSPDVSPVTICGENEYVVFGQGCNGTISWSTGETGMGIYLEEVTSNTNLTATCNQTWVCAPLTNIPFDLLTSLPNLNIAGSTGPNSNQDYYGQSISSSQLINGPSIIDYRAPQSILLQAGFETTSSAVFSAQIGDCVNP
ncbi:Serine protease, subtilisin family [Spirosomataceae bacterium TFI 002]|nr:Serine protease, subtilisin family [Spirosomataceae bacterium TFI 002]